MDNIARKIPFPKLIEKEKRVINDLFFHSDPLKHIRTLDLLFVFGVSRQVNDCVEYLNLLLKRRLKGVLIISGGKSIKDKNGQIAQLESEVIFKGIKSNIDRNLIILERESINTYENIVYSMNKVNLNNICTIGMVSSNLHSLRAYLTMRKYLSKHPIKVLRYSYPFVAFDFPNTHMNKRNWESKNFSERISSEIIRINF